MGVQLHKQPVQATAGRLAASPSRSHPLLPPESRIPSPLQCRSMFSYSRLSESSSSMPGTRL